MATIAMLTEGHPASTRRLRTPPLVPPADPEVAQERISTTIYSAGGLVYAGDGCTLDRRRALRVGVSRTPLSCPPPKCDTESAVWASGVAPGWWRPGRVNLSPDRAADPDEPRRGLVRHRRAASHPPRRVQVRPRPQRQDPRLHRRLEPPRPPFVWTKTARRRPREGQPSNNFKSAPQVNEGRSVACTALERRRIRRLRRLVGREGAARSDIRRSNSRVCQRRRLVGPTATRSRLKRCSGVARQSRESLPFGPSTPEH